MFSSMLSLLGSIRGGSSFITNSLRFRSSASAYLSRTFTATPTTYTLSFWLKRGSLGSAQVLFGSRLGGTGNSSIIFTASDAIEIGLNSITRLTTTSVYRDTSAWYHFVVSVTNNGNVVLYSNGTQVASAAAGSNPFLFNSSWTNTIGRYGDSASFYFDGYLTDVNFIDGQALTPASFGAIDSSTGVWAPRPYSGTYGTNGFYLKFANTSSVAALGNDSSGNNNTWTVNNVSLTAGATYDSMIDVPVNYSDGGNGRGNYCALNPLDNPNTTISASQNGNLTANLGSGSITFLTGTHSVINGKYYWEYTASTVGNGLSLGITYGATTFADVNPKSISYSFSGTKRVLGVDSAYGATYTTNDVIGVAVDSIAGTIQFFKNNVAQPVITDSSISLQEFKPCVFNISSSGASLTQCNFGQRPFQNTTAWATLQAAGFRALNTNNLPTPSIVNGANFMAATTYTGNAAARSLSNAVNSVSFQPDLVWIKNRTAGTFHALFDSARGATRYLSSNTTALEALNANTLTAFTADGFSLGNDTTLVNSGTGGANSYVAWQWKAGGAAVSNTQGTITSQVSANTTAGLSVVTYTGTGVNATVGHGLGVAPKMVIVKNRDVSTENWNAWHTGLLNTATRINLNLPNAQDSASPTIWNSNINPTGATFSIGTSAGTNGSTNKMVAYCFAEIASFSRFGSYTGNGLADGPFVFCGFRPRFVMIKRTDAGPSNWTIQDTSRDINNVSQAVLYPNAANVETTGNPIDCLSNGFKLRTSGAEQNGGGATYIFAAFAENPSKYALAR